MLQKWHLSAVLRTCNSIKQFSWRVFCETEKMAASFCRRNFLNSRFNIFHTPYRTGYIVLIPETPEDLPDYNPLQLPTSLPDFSKLDTEKCSQIMAKHTQKFETGIWELEDCINKELVTNTDKFNVMKSVIEPLETLGVPMDNTWGLVKTLYLADQKVMPGKKYMNIHERARRVRANKFNSLQIYKACKKAIETDSGSLNEEQMRVVKKFVLEGSLNGLEVDGSKKGVLLESLNKMSEKRDLFKSKVETSVRLFKHPITDSATTKDFPVDLLRKMAADPTQPTRGPWTVTLHPHIFHAFMEHCPDREARWAVWQGNARKCSNHNDSTLNTSSDLEEIRYRRHQQALVLGFPNYMHMSMKTKMAETVENVEGMLTTLLEKAKPAQEGEIASLEEFAYDRGHPGNIELWDLAFWKRKQQKAIFNLDMQLLSDYFPLSQVLLGIFTLCEHLFGVKIEEQKVAEAWHPDVRFFRVLEEKSKALLGGFYLDPYSRTDKVNVYDEAGWMVGLRNRSQVCGAMPLAALVFNFKEPLYGKPSLLSFQDVELLFRRFGHTLQHVLTQTTYSEVSGLSNIEWDAVEICSKFMEHWLYERGTLESISGHYETGEPLPAHLLDGLRKSRQHMAGVELCREVYLSNLDMQFHLSRDFWYDIVKRLWPQHFLFELHKLDSHPCSFKEIFTEEWGAAYYCRLWSRVVAADVFSAFVEAGLDNTQELSLVGRRFRSTFLSLGGSCHPSEVFRKFRGRNPSPNALLYIMGLKHHQINTFTPSPALVV